jgi:L-lactate utilization protein LutB
MFASTYCFDEDDRYILILSELLKYKAGPDIQNKKGETALMMAAARPAVPIPSCRYKTVEELLKYNADTKIKDNKGQTALSSLKKLIKKLEAPGFGDYYKKSAEEAKKIAYLLVGKPPKTKGKDKKVGENEIAYIEQIKKDLLTLTL